MEELLILHIPSFRRHSVHSPSSHIHIQVTLLPVYNLLKINAGNYIKDRLIFRYVTFHINAPTFLNKEWFKYFNFNPKNTLLFWIKFFGLKENRRGFLWSAGCFRWMSSALYCSILPVLLTIQYGL